MNAIDFAQPNLGPALDKLSPAEIDTLPFGVIRLSADGVVELYSDTEARLSGFGNRGAVGHAWFDHIAPCMDTDSFRGRMDREARLGTVDFEVGRTGDFQDPARFMRVRVCSARGGGHWLAIQR